MTGADTARDLPSDSASLIRRTYERYANATWRPSSTDPNLEWTYLDPAETDPEPQVCHGRHELERALKRQQAQGLRTELEEVIGQGDNVMVVSRRPGPDALRARQAEDRNFDVFTIRGGRVVALRVCRNRAEAAELAGIA